MVNETWTKIRLCINVGWGQGDRDIGTRVWGLGTWDLGTQDEGLEDINYGTRGQGRQKPERRGCGM